MKANRPNVVLLHGWGLNSAIWQPFTEQFEQQIEFYTIDIPGYGKSALRPSSANLSVLADDCLAQAPEQALWVGWSLGGMIALQAALNDQASGKQQILGLQLLNSTPKFVGSDDWGDGVDLAVFEKFCHDLSDDYERTLTSFLLLQAGAIKGARQLAKQSASLINQFPAPSAEALSTGIECLRDSDLRSCLPAINVPCQVVYGELDRITKPQASAYLAQHLDADLVGLKTGHAPFLTMPDEYFWILKQHVDSIGVNG